MRQKLLNPIEDTFMRGLVGGLVAGIVKDIPDIFLVDLFKIKQLAFWDYVGVMIFNRIPSSFIDHLVAFIVQVAFSLGLGIIYSTVIIPKFTTKHYLVRGLVYGSACWFFLMSLIKLYNVTKILSHDLFTPIATWLFSIGYGILLAYLDHYFSPQKQGAGLLIKSSSKK